MDAIHRHTGRRNYKVRSVLAAFAIFVLQPQFSEAKSSIPDQIRSAQTIYLVNKTEDEGVLKAAVEQFMNWGRFRITQSQSDADLVVMFNEKDSMDKWGNLGKMVMDVFLKGGQKSAFRTTSALHLIYDPQHRTKSCVSQFRKQLEAGN